MTRDSAGISLVESRAAVWSSDDSWQIDSAPEMVLGDDGLPATEFFGVEGAVLGADGGVVVANAGTREIRFFDAAGTLVRTVGTEGEGPGEFRWISSLRPYRGDSLVAYDGFQARASIFDLEGRLGRTLNLRDAELGTPRDLLVLGDGRFLTQHLEATAIDATDVEGLVVNLATFAVWSSDGVSRGVVFSAPGDELYMMPRRPDTDYVRYQVPMFGLTATASVDGTHLITRHDRSFSLAVVSIETRSLDRLVRRHVEARELSERVIDSTYAAWVGVDWGGRALYPFPYPATAPAYGSLRTDDEGHHWVSEYVPPGDQPRRWSVFHPDGRYLGDVVTPLPATLFDVRADRILAVTRDELDVERVVVWRIRKPV